MIVTGFDNEKYILKALNCKYEELNTNLKKIVLALYPDIDPNGYVECVKSKNGSKSDIEIRVGNDSSGISIKKGSGNSVHQEKVPEFIQYISSELGASSEVCNDILFFIWGDYTLDGTGDPSKRVSSSYLKNTYPEKIKNIQKFFDTNKIKLLDRILSSGTKEGLTKADYLYYGMESNGYIIHMDDAIEYLSKFEIVPGVGGLSFQAWNRNLSNKNNNTEKKRGVIQFKWGNLRKDIAEILNA
jgi:hypothetical protein